MVGSEKFSERQSFIQTCKHSETTAGRYSEQRTARGISRGPRNSRHRVSAISGRLYSIGGLLLGTRGPAQLLVDSGASLNLMKERMLTNAFTSRKGSNKIFHGKR